MLELFRKLRGKTMSDYYYEGYDAYNIGYDVYDNPYDPGTYAGNQWEIGWTAAEDYAFKDDENFI